MAITGGNSYIGGGILNQGENLTLSNSTISGNTAILGGGGVLTNSGTTSISNSTVSGNTARFGGGVYNLASTIDLANTIIANSIEGDCVNINATIANSIEGDCVNINATIPTNINNLIEDGTCSSALSGDPNLGPLQNNGGPTLTQALLPDSIAIDAGSNAAIPPGITTDQRGPGFSRIINGTMDIGAYEAGQNVPPSVPEPSSLFGVLTLGLVAIGSVRRRRK